MTKLNYKEYIPTRIKIDDNDCWIWQHEKTEKGYGIMYIYMPGHPKRGVRRKAHRISYEAFNGPIPEGLLVCHTCDVPSCVNPEHLFVGTPKDNMQDMMRKGRGRNNKQKAVLK